MSNYPIMSQSDLEKAPWNQKELQEIEVTVSVTLSKTVKIFSKDYQVDVDEEGYTTYDYSECDLKKLVTEQTRLPQDMYHDWNVDDFEVIKE